MTHDQCPMSNAGKFLFALASVGLVACLALAQRKLFDEPDAPRTDDAARKLANDVIDSVNDSYSKTANYCIKGFKAEYDIQKDGGPFGTMSVDIENQREGRYEVKLLGQAAQDRWLETNLRDCWLYTLAGEWTKHISSARQTAEGYELTYALDPALYKEFKAYVDRDFRILRREQLYKDGTRAETLFSTQTHTGKHYIDSVTVRVTQDADVDELRNELTYRVEDGVPFIRKMDLTRTRTGRPGEKYTVTLKSVQFEQETDVEVLGEDAKLWDDLSKKVISRVLGNEVGMETTIRFVKSFRCNVNVRVVVGTAQPMQAKISLAWDDKDDNGILTGDEIEGKVQYMSSQAMGLYLEEIRQDLVKRISEGRTSLFLKHAVTTAQNEEGYLMKLVPVKKPDIKETKVDGETVKKVGPPGYDTAYLTVSPDFRIQRIRAMLGSEHQTLIEYEYEKLAGAWLATRYTMLSSGGKGAQTVTKVDLTHVVVENLPLLQKTATDVNMHDAGMNVVHLRTELTFTDAKIERRLRPLHPLALRGKTDEDRIFKKLEAEKKAKEAKEGKKDDKADKKNDKADKKDAKDRKEPPAGEKAIDDMSDAELAKAIDDLSTELVMLKAGNAPKEQQDKVMARLRQLIVGQNVREMKKAAGKKTD